MTKSRLAFLLALPLAGAAVAAEPIGADEAIDLYRRMLPPVAAVECQPGAAGEIVVCGRREGARDPNRLPLPLEPVPGERVAGEPLSAVAVAGKRETCSTVGPSQSCGGGLPVLAILGFAAKLIVDTVVKEVADSGD